MKVFLSSTAQDLIEHRQVADDTILRLSQDSVAMERFGPLPGEPVAECERKARESDVVVCIVAHRYGHVPEEGRGSITQREVKAAKAAGGDVLVWIVDEEHPWPEKKEQDRLTDPTVLSDPDGVKRVAKQVQALLAFKDWLRESFVCDTFTTPQELGRKIAIALSAHIKEKRLEETDGKPTRGEVRIVHALQPAPHFQGREKLLGELHAWVSDQASPDRVWSLVAAGGTGKTAVAERVVRDMNPGQANVLVWSFYERPDADAFLRECNHLFLGEEAGPAGGLLERLERGLRDGRPHLIVLDGLELVQEDVGSGRARGELSNQSLKLLLRGLAAGLGRTRALVTSRFPLVDLQDWEHRGYRDTRLDDLSPEAAIAVLRGWEVQGSDAALRGAATQLGHHALSVAVLGSYLRSFADGRIEAVNDFELDSITGDDPKAAKLARVLASYAEKLPEEERELLARLSVFPHGITLDLLIVLVDAGGEVAGLLLNAKPRLVALLRRLKGRGLVFEYPGEAELTWTAHPFLREGFRKLLNCPTEEVFGTIAEALGDGLDRHPESPPREAEILGRYERLIEATRLAGREREAFEIYWFGLGTFNFLGKVLGEYQRAHRILAAFLDGRNEGSSSTSLSADETWLLANDLGLYLTALGRLQEAHRLRGGARIGKASSRWRDSSFAFVNHSDLALRLGLIHEASSLASRGLVRAQEDEETHSSIKIQSEAHMLLALSAHGLGDMPSAKEHFDLAKGLEGKQLVSNRGIGETRHLLDRGLLAEARKVADHGMAVAKAHGWNHELPIFHELLARVDQAEGIEPTPHLEKIRAWTSRTGEMEPIIAAYLLTAKHLLAIDDLQAALGEAESGIFHAEACGFHLLQIELLVVLARIRLAWPDAPQAIQAARKALDLSTAPECGYAWGEADAAHVWGEAYYANRQITLARRAFTQALEVRRRIEHPGLAETERWLARTE